MRRSLESGSVAGASNARIAVRVRASTTNLLRSCRRGARAQSSAHPTLRYCIGACSFRASGAIPVSSRPTRRARLAASLGFLTSAARAASDAWRARSGSAGRMSSVLTVEARAAAFNVLTSACSVDCDIGSWRGVCSAQGRDGPPVVPQRVAHTRRMSCDVGEECALQPVQERLSTRNTAANEHGQ